MADPFRTPEPPLPPRQPAFNMPPVVVVLILVMAGIHLIRAQFLTPDQDFDVVLRFAFIPARYGEFAGDLPGGLAAQIWTPVTYAFLHADWVHFAVNCLWLAAFGSAVARRFGTGRFLVFAAVTAAAGAAAHSLVYPGDLVPVVGASGAISGMMAAAARFALRRPPAGYVGRGAAHSLPALTLVEMVRDRTVMWFLAVWFLLNLGVGLSSGSFYGGGAVAWQAHIGGFVVGLLAFPLFDPVRRPPRPGPFADTDEAQRWPGRDAS